MPTLYLIPNTLAQTFPQTQCYYQRVLPAAALNLCTSLDHWVVENAKTTRAVLKDIAQNHQALKTPLQQQIMADIAKIDETKAMLNLAFAAGVDVGLMSEAGLPCVADPGAWAVAYARTQGWKIEAITGPCSITLALMHSGFSQQGFVFHSYLPLQKNDKKAFLSQPHSMPYQKYIHIAIETPYRNPALLEDFLIYLPNNMDLCVAKNLTLSDEMVISTSIQNWRKNKSKFLKDLDAGQEFNRSPSLFLWVEHK